MRLSSTNKLPISLETAERQRVAYLLDGSHDAKKTIKKDKTSHYISSRLPHICRKKLNACLSSTVAEPASQGGRKL
jgi:hypothetical protein